MASWEASVAAHKQRVRGEIVRHALALVAEKGLAGTTMSEVAKRVGVTRKTLYSYFPDLEHIMVAYLVDEIDAYLEGLTAELAGIPDPLDRLRHCVLRQLTYFATQDRPTDRLRMDAGLSAVVVPELQRHAGRIAAPFATVLRDGIAAGRFRADIDPDRLAAMILELLGVQRAALGREELTPEQGTDELLALLLDGIRADRGAP